MFVYVNGYGLRPFRALSISRFNDQIQLKGQYKLPKNTVASNGKKWMDLDYWFTIDQIKTTKA